MQLSFLKASLVRCEAPTDHAVTATLSKTAHKMKTKYILSGSNLASEAIMPVAWAYYAKDLKKPQGCS